jgi:hypothetical protein
MPADSGGSAGPARLEIGGPRLLDRVHEAIRRSAKSGRGVAGDEVGDREPPLRIGTAGDGVPAPFA